MSHEHHATLPEELPPDEVALSIAADFDPGLRPEEVRAKLDAIAAPLRDQLREITDPIARVTALREHVYGTLGFRGADSYDDPTCELLPAVLDRKVGSPVILAVLLCGLGRRAGLSIDPIAFPGHFLVRVEGLYLDPHSGGFPLDPDGLLVLAHEALADASEVSFALDPSGPKSVGVRLLTNLQNIFRLRGDHAGSLIVCDRLFTLTRAPTHRADRGLHALALGAMRAAVEDLEAYLVACPDERDADQVRRFLARARAEIPRPAN